MLSEHLQMHCHHSELADRQLSRLSGYYAHPGSAKLAVPCSEAGTALSVQSRLRSARAQGTFQPPQGSRFVPDGRFGSSARVGGVIGRSILMHAGRG